MASFLATFRRLYTVVDGSLTDDEVAQAEELVRTKFADPEWTAACPEASRGSGARRPWAIAFLG